MGLGKSMMEWLRNIYDDQNLTGLGQLDDTTIGGESRKWFRRQDLTPTLETGYYDTVTEKYVLGPPDPANVPYQQTYGVSNVSAASHDYVVTDGQVWEITGVSSINTSAASNHTFLFSLDAGTTIHPVPGVNHYGALVVDIQAGISCNLVLTGSTTNTIVRARANTFAGGNVRLSSVSYRRLS